MQRIIFWPFSVVYGIIMALRNHLYNIGYKRSFDFDVPVIGVGNLSLGGNGKTPLVEYLLLLLMDKFKVATLSRGYGRRTRGIRIANTSDNASSLGDEPFQMFNKFGHKVTVVVGEERALAIPVILQENSRTEVVILDDAFQHRSVRPSLNILVTDFYRPFFKDFVLPAGRLREHRGGAARADLIMVTKCPPHLDRERQKEYITHIGNYAPQARIFFSSVETGNWQPLFAETAPFSDQSNVMLVSGIANPRSFDSLIPKTKKVLKHVRFADHHNYKLTDITGIRKEFRSISEDDKAILVTEKDMVKLLEFREHLIDLPIYFLPIRFRLMEGSESFDQAILNTVQSVDTDL